VSEKNPWRFGPTRGELWFWLWVSVAGIVMLGALVTLRGLPEGPAIVEVLGVGVAVFGYLGGRSVKRLVRHQHP
jgi:hypothetical protein